MPRGGDMTRMYPPKVTEYARRLYNDGEGRTVNEIRESLRKLGYEPKRDTVRYWVEPGYAEEKRRRARRFNPPGPAPRKAWRRRLERMEDLRAAGLSYTNIARVISLDFHELDLNTEQVRSVLKGNTRDQHIRALLWPEVNEPRRGRPVEREAG